MLKTPIARGVALASLGATLAIPSLSQAAFIDDSKASLELRNFYFNRDFRDGGTPGNRQSKQEEWAQGFLLRYESGFTEGTVGFGVDAIGLLGVQLNSGGGTGGTGLLPGGYKDDAPDNYSEFGLTAKAKLSNTVLKIGSLQFKNPALGTSDSRLLPQLMQGAQLVSKEIDGLTLDLGYANRTNLRNSSNHEVMTVQTGARRGITAKNGAALAVRDNESDDFRYLGGSYAITKDLTATYYYSKLEDLYKQHSTNLVHVLPLGEGRSLKTDLRYARSKDDGRTNIDNKALGAMVTYSQSGHSFGLGYQKMSGDTGFAYVGGATDPFLVNYVQINDFGNKDEKSWQARYDFNFASVGIPGLSLMTRYLTGDGFERANGSNGKEWERDTDIAYTIQGGTFKNLNIRWRNATVRNNYDPAGRDIDENRLIVSYTIPLL